MLKSLRDSFQVQLWRMKGTQILARGSVIWPLLFWSGLRSGILNCQTQSKHDETQQSQHTSFLWRLTADLCAPFFNSQCDIVLFVLLQSAKMQDVKSTKQIPCTSESFGITGELSLSVYFHLMLPNLCLPESSWKDITIWAAKYTICLIESAWVYNNTI